MTARDHQTTDTPPGDEGALFSAAAQRYITALHVSPEDVDGYWTQIQSQIDWKGVTTTTPVPGSWQRERTLGKHPPRLVRWYALAGVALGALLMVAGWSVITRNVTGHGRVSAGSTYTTANGQRANITLPDGSTVVLGVASRLDVPADYSTGNHKLHLSGEALFTVMHHDGAPFVVVAGSMATQVLGTTFLVRHYSSDSTIVVAVRDGKVAVRSGSSNSPVVLTSAQQLTLGRTKAVGVQPANLTQFSFATGVLTIDGMPLRTAIAELDRWYDADIRLGDTALADRQIAGGFTAGSLADLTVILEWTFNMRVVRDGRVLTLFPR